MKTKRGIITSAVTIGVAPPLALGVLNDQGFTSVDTGPLILGSAIWLVCATILAAGAILRLRHQAH